ncbi:hypothetical protein H0A36_24265 [Endozoicomonas sp. SM1973]|uniref:DUF6708 domain-containing protein n=1 Tax=Spartinivicinus marinus TaxID=2994442 RepID=A0A853I8H7_9GAMM|nr:DUF6708 domain-containing protein [Spartinivicinus marinus]MCX4029291.1 hypothetical protein [Spartinivicinus marinus]NYZ69139.1 hypothetical protein [Spartinivicinus marinus]
MTLKQSEQRQRGWKNKGFLESKYYIAPPPLPTEQKPCDFRGMVLQKNDVFMDLSTHSIRSGAGPLSLFIFFSLFVIWIDNEFGIEILLLLIMLPSLIYIIKWCFRPVTTPIRLNRQKREAYIVLEDGRHWIVPWEKVRALVSESHSYGSAGKQGMAALTISFPNPDDNVDEGVPMMAACGDEKDCEAQWECIRIFMEGDLADVPDGLIEGRFSKSTFQVFKELRKEDNAFGAYLVFIFFGIWWIHPLERWKFKNRLSIPPEMEEWSKPIPKEQWAKRSPELQQAFDQYYLEQEKKGGHKTV